MTPDELIQQRKRDWERLTALLQRAQRADFATLGEAELVEFGRLYRAATSDLALAQRDFPNHALTLYLNQLVGRAHPFIYRGEPLVARRLREFYTRGLPQLYREFAPFILAAALLLFGPAVLAYTLGLVNPDSARYVISQQQIDLIKEGTPWWKDLNGGNETGAAFIMTHNLQVAFFAFAGGMLLGIFSVYILIANGLQLGMVFGLLQFYGHAAPLWEFVIGHGVLELSEVLMAGGSGLMLGYAMLHPGLLSRGDALVVAAHKAIRLLLGSAPLLVVAGTIEGVISPSAAPALLKYAIGITSGLLLYGYLFFAGREMKNKFVIRITN
jgi:uncharacterized membrane protein SpoIIM required for sporulation